MTSFLLRAQVFTCYFRSLRGETDRYGNNQEKRCSICRSRRGVLLRKWLHRREQGPFDGKELRHETHVLFHMRPRCGPGNSARGLPVQNSFLKRSGIMQVYGFAAGSHYTGGPYKAYRGCTYSHSSRCDTNGLDVSWTHDRYEIRSLNSAGVFEISIAHQRTVVARAITGRPNLAVFSAYDNSIERYYTEDLVLERPLAPSLGLSNVKDFSLTWTLSDLKDVMASARLGAMNYNPAYMREVFERD
jgi:hypothetical protein